MCAWPQDRHGCCTATGPDEVVASVFSCHQLRVPPPRKRYAAPRTSIQADTSCDDCIRGALAGLSPPAARNNNIITSTRRTVESMYHRVNAGRKCIAFACDDGVPPAIVPLLTGGYPHGWGRSNQVIGSSSHPWILGHEVQVFGGC